MARNDPHSGHTPRAIRATAVGWDRYVCEYVYEGEPDDADPYGWREFIPGRQMVGRFSGDTVSDIAIARTLPVIWKENV